jgi:ribose/xylose/arabinose/galactoside ABC-type transport system permease subunit
VAETRAVTVERRPAGGSALVRVARLAFVRLGALPLLLLLLVVGFGIAEPRFLSGQNIFNVARQSTYLTIVAMAQMLALLTGGFDLSVGVILAITSVVSAYVMAAVVAGHASAVGPAITLGILAGLGAGTAMGVANGLGIAVLNVSPFMMTLAMASIGFGLALFMTGGVPVYGMPSQFGATLGFGKLLGIPVPVYVTVVVILAMYVLLYWTRIGRYFYAIGGNIKAAALSGISTRWCLFLAYVLCGFLASLAGVMLTARLETGEANIGAAMPLRSIAACVIGGVSLRGGTGRLGSVVLAAVFIEWFENGMNLVRIQSYLQMVALGGLLIFAVVMDEVRHYYIAKLRAD